MRTLLTLFILLGFGIQQTLSQESASLTLILDGTRSSVSFSTKVKDEINTLLGQQYTLSYNEVNLSTTNQSVINTIQAGLNDDSDILITFGFKSSSILKSINNYPKPCIAGIVLEKWEKESTQINNFTLVESPFDIQKDFEVFQSIYPFKNLAIFVQSDNQVEIESYLSTFKNGFDIQFIGTSDNPEVDINQLNPDIDAVYFLPNIYENPDNEQKLIDGINEHRLPSFSLIGRDGVEKGILASVSPSEYIDVYARRIALNVMKVLEGQNPKDLPVKIDGIEDDFVINVATMEKIEIYPSLDVLSQASLIDLEIQTGKNYTLQSAVAEALTNNLSFLAAQKEVDIQQTEIGIAKSNLLPTVNASTSLVTLDGTTAELLKSTNQLTPQTQWAGNLELTQLIYSQPSLANVAIQKALLESEKAGLMSQQLDLVLNVCSAYIQVLQAQANQNIQNTNVQTTLSNLKIAKTKAKIGTVSNADIYGFESQLALNKSSLNDAQTIVEQARIQFNQFLNRPLDEDFVLEDLQLDNQLLFLQDSRMRTQINNLYDIRKFAEFLIETALNNAPEFAQLDWAIKAQEHSLDLNKKSLYLPQIGLQGNLDQTFGRYGTKVPDASFEALGVDPYQPTWNVGVNASLPIFQGNLRNKRIQQDKIVLQQLAINRSDLELQFATNIRLSLENLGNSYNQIQFTRQASLSSTKYLELIQDLYREGATNIVTLLDAQNNAVSAQLGFANSQYQFILDAITIERLFNKIYLLSTPKDRESFINDYLTFLIKKDKND